MTEKTDIELLENMTQCMLNAMRLTDTQANKYTIEVKEKYKVVLDENVADDTINAYAFSHLIQCFACVSSAELNADNTEIELEVDTEFSNNDIRRMLRFVFDYANIE